MECFHADFFFMKVEWPEFAAVLAKMLKEEEEHEENTYKETYRVFSKDDKGCIPAEEMKFVLSQVCSMEVSTRFFITCITVQPVSTIFYIFNSKLKHLSESKFCLKTNCSGKIFFV